MVHLYKDHYWNGTTFVGSNNINLLKPNGQFGIALWGPDAASSRYIHTLNRSCKLYLS